MIRKEVKTKLEGMDNGSYVKDVFEHEPISRNIYNSINDFYNLLHLIENSWSNKDYILKMSGAGYDIYDKADILVAWIGVKEKYEYISFIIIGDGAGSFSKIYHKAEKMLKGPMRVIEFNEDLWLYSYIELNKIIGVEDVEKQQEVLKSWIKEKIEKIL